MTYSRVALLLALALITQTAVAWTGEISTTSAADGTVRLPLSCLNSDQQAAPFRSVTCLPPGKMRLMNPQLCRLVHRSMSLVEANTARVMDYASRYWRQGVAYYRSHGRTPTRLAISSYALPRVTFDDFAGLSRMSPAKARYIGGGTSSQFDMIEYACIGVLPINADPKRWFSVASNVPDATRMAANWSAGRSLAKRLILGVERSFGDWDGAFRNISRQFAQLNWTFLVNGRTVDRAAEKTTQVPRVVER